VAPQFSKKIPKPERMAVRESTGLYDRRSDTVALDEVEKVVY
jgi:hypothetical protein